MKPLLYVATVMSLAWVVCGAPQPLINLTTVSDLSDLSTRSNESGVTSLPSISDRDSSSVSDSIMMTDSALKESSAAESGSTFLSAEARGETDATMTFSDSAKNEISSTTSLVNEFSTDVVINDKIGSDISVTTQISSTVKEDGISIEDIPISRYVPPLDPIKHMLMMADIKNAPKISIATEVIETTLSSTNVPTTLNVSAEPDIVSSESSDLSEKVVAESSEVEEKMQPPVTETTIRELTTVEIWKKSDDMVAIKELIAKTSSDASSTEIFPTTIISLNETAAVSTETPEKEENTLALLKHPEEILKTDFISTEKEKEPENDVTSSEIFSSTEESLKVESTTVSANLLKGTAEPKIEKNTIESESTTAKIVSTTENEIVLKNSETSTTIKNKDIISTTLTTTNIPETTFESSTAQTPDSNKKIVSLDDELEFRAVKLPILNESKVQYVQRRPIVTVDPDVSELSSLSSDETEFTTANILTTIAELLFPLSSTTESSEKPATEREPEITSEESIKDTSPPLSVDEVELPDVRADSGVVLASDPSDMLKVQSLKSGLDSLPADEITTIPPVTEETSTEEDPEVFVDELFAEMPELKSDEIKLEIASEVEKGTTEEPFSISLEASTTTESPTTIAATTILESKPEGLEEKDTEKVDTIPEVQNDPPDDETNSDYLLNVKNRYVSGENRDMVEAVQFLHYHDKASSEQCFKLVDAHWNYATNLTEENKKKQLEQTLEYSLFHKEAWKNATSFAWKSFNDTLLRRWFKSLSVLGTAALPEDKLNEFNKIKAEMKNTYSTAKICGYVSLEAAKKVQIIREKDCGLTLEPDLQRILTKSRDYDELLHVWKSWRDAAGKPLREKYLRFVNLSNEAARMNGFSDTGDMWREAYESETFETDLEELWEQLRPLYEHLHAYVRRRLIGEYGSDRIKENGPIPAHLFGNMWAQSWVSLLDIAQPFSGKPSVDVTPIMEAKNMTAYEMFKISEEFFTSLGLKPMPEPFWKHSLIEKPKDREIICHASAWDFCNGKDYRIKQCTDITMDDLITVHHEMGHIQYFLQYSRQPNVFREGANPGFHEAIGDVLALSVSTPMHLKSIGLLDEVADDPEGDLNFLLYTALDKVSFLPSGYLIDLWRWGLFSGDIKPEEMNTKWWELRLKYQGICPPVKRTDADFDPGAKFHVPGNVPYIRYFVSFVIQFQFHKVLCDAAGHTGPLYKCDIYRSKEAGQILSQVMELGSSEHWSEAMKIMTGGATNKMDAGPILEYFEPLLEFLKEQNRNETIGWESSDVTICP